MEHQKDAMSWEELVRQRLEQRNATPLLRAAPGKETRDLHVRLFAEHVAATVRHHVEGSTRAANAEAAASMESARANFGEGRTASELRTTMLERVDLALAQSKRTLQFTVPAGSRMFGTPYDLDWQVGGGLAFGGRVDGSAITVSTAGFSAAGLGFYVSSSEPLLAAITPVGSYDFNWFSFQDLPTLRSRGGMGITVYANQDPQPEQSRQAVLWSVAGVAQYTGDKGTGRIGDAASPAFGFGPVPLAPVFLQLGPAVRYLVWVWCWQTKTAPEPSNFLAFMQFHMPFVTVDAGPPIIIR